jgi:acetyl-CoA carboxylase biotin carboxylase subunit
MKLKKILIANRGEIAVRVIRTAKALGIEVVTIYADDDRMLPHATMSTEAYCLGSGALKDTYLNQDKILDIALKSGSEAIHPGYGFLSENSGFARKVEKAGLIFIGPTPENIDLMGDKIGSKKAVEKINVPMIPGYHGSEQSEEFLSKKAKEIGFPVLIKASAGGGGKGMRIVDDASGFSEALQSAKSEALKAFSNDAVLLEKYVVNPRHIEVQVMSDQHDQHFHLFERECSIQRRYQKIIEETPAPRLDDSLRLKICETARSIAAGIKYRGAGTVEFILTPENDFYFLEMNTRLQVEHPITEEVLGLDLVKLQLQVAAGEKLPLKQSDIKQMYHSIECRICAEDPDNGFLPTTGKISYLGKAEIAGSRLDSGFIDGAEVGINYDSMLAKLIVRADTRAEAIEKMLKALDDVPFTGVKNNRDYLKRILGHEAFKRGETHTHFIKVHENDLKPVKPQDDVMALLMATKLWATSSSKTSSSSTAGSTPWQKLSNWRNA